MKVGVVGSRKGYPLDHVGRVLADMHEKYPEAIVVSGGADGVDTYSEQTWLAFGHRVISLRPTEVAPGVFRIQRWELGIEVPQRYTLLDPHPSWGDYKSACFYRDMLIAEESDRGLAFRANKSRGTGLTMSFFENEGKPCHVFEPAAPAGDE